jgi:hypothetical protein
MPTKPVHVVQALALHHAARFSRPFLSRARMGGQESARLLARILA